METLPIANINRNFSAMLKALIKKDFPSIKPIFLYTKKTFREHMIYETPELVVINFTDKPKVKFEILNDIYKDKWLNSAGIIAIHDSDNEEEFVKKVKHANIIAAIHVRDLESSFNRILKIVIKHRHILFQRAFQSMFIGKISGSFIIDNDLLDIQVYANLITNYVFNSNYIDEDGKMSLKLIVSEMLINSCEHGNCGITFDEKTEFTNKGVFLADIIKEKMKLDPLLKDKKIRLEYNVNNLRTWIRITDDGEGFDWQKRIKENSEKSPDELLFHGRGIYLSTGLCRNFKYNTKGNAVHFEFIHNNSNHIVPGFFEKNSETLFKKGDIVFKKGETSNYLYYIASGEYEVMDENGKVFSILTPNDIFIGEMSFLLYNIRTATVKVKKGGTLYRLSKRNFIEAIKKLPYYSMVLCKILAKRLEMTNQRISDKDNSPVIED